MAVMGKMQQKKNGNICTFKRINRPPIIKYTWAKFYIKIILEGKKCTYC